MFIQSREILDKKSLFVAYLITVSSDKDVRRIMMIRNLWHHQISQAKLKIRQSQSSSPSHSISAYRFVGLKSKKIGLNQDDFTVKTAYDDDGEKWAGKRILEVLEQTWVSCFDSFVLLIVFNQVKRLTHSLSYRAGTAELC